jgi:hypothetical protein
MILANDGIRFPVTYPTAGLDDGGPTIDGTLLGIVPRRSALS